MELQTLQTNFSLLWCSLEPLKRLLRWATMLDMDAALAIMKVKAADMVDMERGPLKLRM